MRPVSAEALLAGVVDYAGLFPPAALSMPEAVAAYQAAQAGAEAWMLGRFVVPATRLGELGAVLGSLSPAPSPWRLSALVRDGSETDRAAVADFNARGAQPRAIVDAVEAKPATVEGIDWLAGAFGGVEVYVELTPGPDLDAWFARLAARGLRAKVRTGGITADAFPDPGPLAALLAAAVRHGVTLKATAGLHHAVRGRYPLTYEPDAAAAPMYGYLNLLLAVAALRDGGSTADAETLLQASDATALTFGDDAVRWGSVAIPAATIRDARARSLVSFGSCSFREPAEEFAAIAARPAHD